VSSALGVALGLVHPHIDGSAFQDAIEYVHDPARPPRCRCTSLAQLVCAGHPECSALWTDPLEAASFGADCW
jgi:hypothetical protein